jgi:CheY-like chemotaxis protein
MPEMNGFDASKEIRNFENLNQLTPIPIMALSADVTSSELETLNKFGINDYLSKPFDALVLKEKIELLVSNHKK